MKTDLEKHPIECDAAWEIVARLELWMKMPADQMRLRCGEMSGKEIRSIRAVLNIIHGGKS